MTRLVEWPALPEDATRHHSPSKPPTHTQTPSASHDPPTALQLARHRRTGQVGIGNCNAAVAEAFG